MLTTKGARTDVDKKKILKRVSQIEIFNLYSGWLLEIGVLNHSPLREDNNPSFILLDGEVINYFDFKTGETGDCFTFVMRKTGLTFGLALLDIDKKLSLGLTQKEGIQILPSKQRRSNSKSTIRLLTRPFNVKDKDFWKSFNITKKTLDYFKVRPITRYDIDGYTFLSDPISYAYKIGSRVKIYQPFNKKGYKFFGNTNQNSLQGYEYLQHKTKDLYIVSSFKEVFILHELGFEAIAVNSESSICKVEIIDYLLGFYENIYVLFDWDEAGHNLTTRFCEAYGGLVQPTFIPLSTPQKDLSDYSKEYGIEETRKLLNEKY